MSETTESFEQLVKCLKPLKILVTKISADKLAKLRVVDDPNLIKDESICNGFDPQIDKEVEEDDEEIEIDLNEDEIIVETIESRKTYNCFFCKKSIIGLNDVVIHYKLHIDYFPVQCLICDEANTDVLSFVRHCRTTHPELKRAKYVVKRNPVYESWVQNFLKSDEPNPVVHMYCPACEWVHLIQEENEGLPPKAVNIIRHIHQHIQYKPFDCIKCRESGNEYRIHYLDKDSREHISSVHKLEPPFWQHFSRKFAIPALDRFITNYLKILEIKVPKRITKKRPKPASLCNTKIEQTVGQTVGQTSQQFVSNNTIVSTNQMIANQPKQLPITLTMNAMNNSSLLSNILFPMNQIRPQTIISNGRALTTIMRPQMNQSFHRIDSNIIEMISPLQIMPSSSGLNIRPIVVESTDLGIVCLDPKIIEIEESFFKYVCIFCDEEKVFDSKIEICLHLNIHFSYYPIVCMLCEKTFLDLSTLVFHYNKFHNEYQNNIFHYLKENEKIENWIQSFVEYQKTHEFKANVSAIFGDHCFVCQKLTKNETSFRMSCKKNETKMIRDHIHQHLNYFPYKCLICYHGNRTVKFTSLNASAVTHFHIFHGFSNENKLNHFLPLIAKTDEILELENFIESKLFNKREKSSETSLFLNLKRKLEEIETETKKRLENSKLSTNPLPSVQVLPMIRENNILKTYSKTDNTSANPIKVVNSLSPQKPLNGTVISTKPIAVNPIEYIPNRKSYIEPYLLCFHCHQKVSNTKQLESHHQSKHPKLTIASYAPTKRDFTTN